MSRRNRLTNNSDETDIAALLSGDVVFSIPYFQRPYKWKRQRLSQLDSDVLALVDESSDFHFLGAVIVHGRRSNPSDPDVFEVIDGQQRITTLFLYLCAAIKMLAEQGEHQEAAALFLKYLVINRDTGRLSNFKLQSCKDDRNQLNEVYDDLLQNDDLKAALGGFELRRLPRSGSQQGTLLKNYRATLRFLANELNQGGLDRIRAIIQKLLNNVSVVQIDVWDPTDGPKIFDSLNSRQEPISIGDLVRNEVFSRVADQNTDLIERIDAEKWQPFYRKFDYDGKNLFDGYFFPYGLTKNPNLKKSEAYTYLRKEWEGMSGPVSIIDALGEFQDAYLDFYFGENFSNHSPRVANAFSSLTRLRSPSSILPFFMQLSNGVCTVVSEEDAVRVCAVLESFLVRRAVCGYEPTGLHSVFKRLWRDCDGNINQERVTREISKHKTVPWPDNDEFKKAIEERSLYKVGVTPFVILEYDKSLGGDQPGTVPWVEHVLPQNPDEQWFDVFTRTEHEQQKDRLANLLPLSSEMNRELSNSAYDVKRGRLREDSMFKSAREFASKFSVWDPVALKSRGETLSAWAIRRWAAVRSSTGVRDAQTAVQA